MTRRISGRNTLRELFCYAKNKKGRGNYFPRPCFKKPCPTRYLLRNDLAEGGMVSRANVAGNPFHNILSQEVETGSGFGNFHTQFCASVDRRANRLGMHAKRNQNDAHRGALI